MKNSSFNIILFCVSVSLLLVSCQEPVFTPKPRAYPRIDFPEKAYVPFETAYCPMTFEMPAYAKIVKDTLYFDQKPENPCWFNLEFESLNGSLHCSYKAIDSRDKLDKLINDSHNLANQHIIKADYIDPYLVSNPFGVSGAILEIQGSVASPFQFYLTDSTKNFLRGSLYFNSRPEPDSMAPVINFVKEDLMHMINTFRWK